MTVAQITAGFESSSGFRDALSRMFGDAHPREDNCRIFTANWISSPLGPLFAVASDCGLAMLDFVDKSNFESAAKRMKHRIESADDRAVIVPGEHRYLSMLKTQLEEYFDGGRRDCSVPLDPHGTDFERRVWDYLCTIPFGETRSYGQQARAIGKLGAVSRRRRGEWAQ